MELHKEAAKLAKVIKAKRDLISIKNKQNLIKEHLEKCKIEMKNIFIDPRNVVEGQNDIAKFKCQVCKGIVV